MKHSIKQTANSNIQQSFKLTDEDETNQTTMMPQPASAVWQSCDSPGRQCTSASAPPPPTNPHIKQHHTSTPTNKTKQTQRAQIIKQTKNKQLKSRNVRNTKKHLRRQSVVHLSFISWPFSLAQRVRRLALHSCLQQQWNKTTKQQTNTACAAKIFASCFSCHDIQLGPQLHHFFLHLTAHPKTTT